MAFYTEERLNENRVLSDADFNVGFADYLGATISDAWHDNPTVATIELGEVYTAQVGRDALADLMGDSFDTETDVSDFEPTASPALSLEDQQDRIKEAGLEKHIKAQEGYNAEALNLVMESKREELERQVTRQAASDWYAPAGFIAGLGTSMLDPINLASNFIPGVGQIRALRMLQEGAKQGAKGLALRRAAIGAAEGAVGSVVVEPLVALARSQQQADYGMTDSLLNVAFGTVMGATLHPAIGAWRDYKRKQAQKNNPLITAPWEVVPPTDKTEALRHQFAQDALAKAREAGASMTEEQAYASAALFDARARTVAYFENIDPEEYYKRHRPEFEAELERMGELEQGMYRNKADMHTFIQNTMAGMYGKKTFIGIGELSNEAFPGYELQMTDDTVRHVLREEHAGFDDWESVVDVVNTGEAEALDASTRVTGNKVTVYAKKYGDRVQVALVSPRSEKRRELMLLTTFNTTEKGYAQWMEGIKKDPSQTDAYILTGRGGESPQGLPTGYEEPFSESNIPQTSEDINTLFQNELAEAVIKDTEKGGSIELGDGSYIYWETTSDSIEVYDEDGMLDYEDGPEYMLISALYVSPESRGKGLGRRLLRSALNRISRTRPGIDIRLSADPIADEAVAQEDLVGFYSSEGFDAEYVDGMSGVPMTWDRRPRWTDVNTLYQRAWHGGPRDFDRFDFSYMGSGEGHQVHGWGGYVAASKDISDRRYRERFAKGYKLTLNGENLQGETAERLISEVGDRELYLAETSGSLDGVKDRVRGLIEAYRNDPFTDNLVELFRDQLDRIDAEPKLSIAKFIAGVPAGEKYRFDSLVKFAKKEAKEAGRRASIADVRKWIENQWATFSRLRQQALDDAQFLESFDLDKLEVRKNEGQLFELEIPEEEEMLIEWKTFSEQMPAIQEAIFKAFGIGEGKTVDSLVGEIDRRLAEIYKQDSRATNAFEKSELAARHGELRGVKNLVASLYTLKGKDIYKALAGYLGSPKAASLALLREGVQGISYKGGIDGQAWVIFDENKMQILDKLYQLMEGQTETPRGSVTFRPEDGKAVITFFKNTDASTLPHEMFHIFRRELAETAGMEGANPQSRDMWAKVCEFVGAKEGEPWTREQEEMFARAGERYLLEGKAPNAQLRGVFERMKQWFMEIYTSVDAAGMEISDTMRQVFGDMFKLSPEEADMAFRYGFGKMLEWDGSEGTDTAIPELPESDDPAMQEEMTGLAVQRLEESLQGVADRPDFAEAVRKQVEQEIAVLDAEMEQSRIQGEVLLEAALCDMRS